MKWPGSVAIALCCAVLVAAGWRAAGPRDEPVPLARPADAPLGVEPAVVPSAAAVKPQETVPSGNAGREARGPSAPPPGVSAEQWQQLVAEHAGRPDGAAELQRLADYFGFADQMQRFRQLRKSAAATPELAPLAQSIDRELDTHLRRGEVNGGEARAIKAAVLEVLLPDEAARQAALRQWQAAASPVVPQAAEARARDAEFLRQQAALVAAWSAQAPAERDQRALERDLAALKQATYAPRAERAATPATPRRTP